MKIYFLPTLIRTIIFDIDSTLYTNPEYAYEQIDVQVRFFADLRGMSYDEARNCIATYRFEYAQIHNGRQVSLGNTLVHFGIPIEQSIEWRKTLINPCDFLSADKKLHEMLQLLSKQFSFIAVTNNPEETARKTLVALGVDDFFSHLIGLDTYGVSKPHLRSYQAAAQLMKTDYCHCLSVGDRYDIDLAVPLELGMGAILVDGVEDVYDLVRILL